MGGGVTGPIGPMPVGAEPETGSEPTGLWGRNPSPLPVLVKPPESLRGATYTEFDALPAAPTVLKELAGTDTETPPRLPLKSTVPAPTLTLRLSKSNVVPRTEAVALGLDMVMEALAPAGGLTSTRTLPD